MGDERLAAIALRVAQYGATIHGSGVADSLLREETSKDYADIIRAGLWEEMPVSISDRARPFASAVVADMAARRLYGHQATGHQTSTQRPS